MFNSSKKIGIWLLILVVVLLVVLYWLNIIPNNLFLGANTTYQAVFLTNGQVYFGHLSEMWGQYPDLKDVYYLQVTQPSQPLQPSQANSPANINLVKLGGELHGPTDEMRINRDQILFIENLRSDSGVVKAIQQLSPTAAK